MSRRTVALVVSVLLAALATVALISYVRGLENKTYRGQVTVTVFVAKDTIPEGTSAEAASSRSLFDKAVIPVKVEAAGAIGSLDEIKGKVAQVTIVKGEQIIATRWVAPGQQGLGLAIPDNLVAMSVQVDLVPGVAGFVQPGNNVSIIAQLTVPKAGGGGQATQTKVQFLLQNIQVLAIGPRVVTVAGQQQPAQQQAQGSVLATIAVTPVQAEKLAYAIFQGKLYLTLLPQGSKPVGTPGRTQDNAFS